MSEQPIVEASDLHTYYGTSHVLHGVDLVIRRGEALALMGRNGMGKTTLIRTLLGEIPPRRGTIRINGKNMTGAAPHLIAREGIGYVPEGRGIFPNLSVRENLLVAARPDVSEKHGWTLERVIQVFPRLSERLGHGGQQLSGGEQQMLAIGRALMTNPALLILDEATEGLAPLVASEIWRIVCELRQGGLAVIIVDKNFAALSTLTDRAILLVKGRIVFDGKGDELRRQPEILHQHLGI
jgi:branched-chain amino acid transport system ATP-binding protein